MDFYYKNQSITYEIQTITLFGLFWLMRMIPCVITWCLPVRVSGEGKPINPCLY